MNKYFLLKVCTVMMVSCLLLTVPVAQAYYISSVHDNIALPYISHQAPYVKAVLAFLGALISYKQRIVDAEPTTVNFQGSCYIGNNICNDGGEGACCEEPVGCESSENACFDCGCDDGMYGDDYYCDGTGAAENWQCRLKPTGSSIGITDIEQTSFPKFDAGNDETGFSYTIAPFPEQQDVTASSEGCEAVCNRVLGEEEEECNAECAIVCGGDVEEGRICILEIIEIVNYDSTYSYTITPTMNLTLTLIHPPYVLPGLDIPLERAFPQPLVFAASYCGDEVVDPITESESTCCYDTGCPDGYYCYIEDPEPIPRASSCLSESTIQLDVSLDDSSFFDSTVGHYTDVTFTINGKPGGLGVGMELVQCELEDGSECDIEECVEGSVTENDYSFSCNLRIPPINFRESEFFDEPQGKLILDGEVAVPITFNDGAEQGSLDLIEDFGPIEIVVQTSCPGDGCDFDENPGQPNHCPADCGCPGGEILVVEFGGDRGVCISEEGIGLQITAVEPSFPVCLVTMDNIDINRFRGTNRVEQIMATAAVECQPDPVRILARIAGGPTHVDVTSSRITVNGEEHDVNCIEGDSARIYTCSFVLRNQRASEIGQKDVELTLTAEYTSLDAESGTEVTISKELSDSAQFTPMPVLAQDVQALLECKAVIDERSGEEESMGNKRSTLITIVSTIAAITVSAIVACILSEYTCTECCYVAAFGVVITFCVAAPLLWGVGDSIDRINEIRESKEDACRATGIRGLADANEVGGATAARIGAGVSAVICAILVAVTIGGGGIAAIIGVTGLSSGLMGTAAVARD